MSQLPLARTPLWFKPAFQWVLVCLSLGLLTLISLVDPPEGRDFHVYFVAMQSVAHTGNPFAIWPPAEVPYMYPPLLAYLMQPMRGLDLTNALLVWTALNVAMAAGIYWLSVRMSGAASLRRAWGLGWFILILSGPGSYLLRLGQLGGLIGLLLIASIAAFKKSFPLSALLLALAINIKLYPVAMALPYLLWGAADHRERLRRFGWMAFWTLGIFAAGGLVWGWPLYWEFADRVFLRPVFTYPYDADFNVSINAFFLRLFALGDHTTPIIEAPRLARALTLLADGAVFAACVWCSWVERARRPELVFSVWTVGIMLISPSNGSYNLVALALPLACLIARLERRPDRKLAVRALLAGGILALPTAAGILGLHRWLYYDYGTLVLSAPIYALTGLFILLLRCVADEREPRAATRAAPAGELKSAP